MKVKALLLLLFYTTMAMTVGQLKVKLRRARAYQK